MDNPTPDAAGASDLLSRTGARSPIGPLTEPVATKVSAELKEAFARLCTEANSDVSAALRNYMCKVVHGKTFDQLVREDSQRMRLKMSLEGDDGLLLVNPPAMV